MKKLDYHFKNKKRIQKSILQWYDANGRHNLPWKNESIYRIWISEIMLQQTQVKTVIPYYEKFLQSYPSIGSLINASQDDILKHWAGLGYYRRAKNIYAACRMIEKNFDSKFPITFNDILKLPGIGRTTASAITTFSQNGKHSILDANVKRFLRRIYNLSEGDLKDTDDNLWFLSEDLLPNQRPDDFIQAYMDIGSLICKNKKPDCSICPTSSLCLSLSNNNVETKQNKKYRTSKVIQKKNLWSVVVYDENNKLYLEKISLGDLWSGLYSSPIFTSHNDLTQWAKSKKLIDSISNNKWSFQHRLSHINFTITVFVCNLKKNKKVSLMDDNWYNLSNITIGIPKYQNKINEKFRQLI